jgi:hypothetical protein
MTRQGNESAGGVGTVTTFSHAHTSGHRKISMLILRE